MREPVAPVIVVDLFVPLGGELLTVLRALTPEAWSLPTACAPWTVKDVAAHLLGGSLGRLWPRAPGSVHEGPRLAYAQLLALINRSNTLWVEAARRISPDMLIELLALTDVRLQSHFHALDLDAPASITVAWAGDGIAPNWFDVAREYTEKWLHQQHIRETVGWPLLSERRWLHPVLDTFLRGLPHAYRQIEAEPGVSVVVQINGEAGGTWSLVRGRSGWQLYLGDSAQAASRVQIDQDSAWRLFTKGISPAEARPSVMIVGELSLGEPLLEMVSIMA